MQPTDEVPLPEPAGSIIPEDGDSPVDAVTFDQMRTYAAACVAAERQRIASCIETALGIAGALVADHVRDDEWPTERISGWGVDTKNGFFTVGANGIVEFTDNNPPPQYEPGPPLDWGDGSKETP